MDIVEEFESKSNPSKRLDLKFVLGLNSSWTLKSIFIQTKLASTERTNKFKRKFEFVKCLLEVPARCGYVCHASKCLVFGRAILIYLLVYNVSSKYTACNNMYTLDKPPVTQFSAKAKTSPFGPCHLVCRKIFERARVIFVRAIMRRELSAHCLRAQDQDPNSLLISRGFWLISHSVLPGCSSRHWSNARGKTDRRMSAAYN